MNIKEAYNLLKKTNPLLKPLSEGAPLWKKVILEYLEKPSYDVAVRKAVSLVALSIDDDNIYNKFFESFYAETDDDVRKFMVEAIKDNCNDIVIDRQMSLIGIRERSADRYIRQIVSQNITNALKLMMVQKPFRANIFLSRLKKKLLNDDNTFTRMNAAIILRNLGDKKCLPELEHRLEEEKKLQSQHANDVGIPYVIRELERSISYLKERA